MRLVGWNEVEARNKRMLDEGSFEGPIVSIGLRPPEPKKHNAGDEATAEKVSMWELLDCEMPENAPKAGEGGSSGSAEVLGEPPLPPPEAPASMGEGVKKKIAEAPVRLERESYLALEDELIAVAKPEDLRLQDREVFEGVKGARPGCVCSVPLAEPVMR